MNTPLNRTILMSSSALFMGLLGLAATFLPQEILSSAGVGPPGTAPLIVQLSGALYLAFAMLNWMGRDNLIGGIYSRPVAIANTLHFTMGALALLKGVATGTAGAALLLVFAWYALFAIAFSVILFSHPTPPGA